MPSAKREREPLRQRLVEIRERSALTQIEFVARLNERARELYGDLAPRYNQSAISKLENGPNKVLLTDVAVYAGIDPQKRGKLWLAWGSAVDETMEPKEPATETVRVETGEFFAEAPDKSATPAKGRRGRSA